MTPVAHASRFGVVPPEPAVDRSLDSIAPKFREKVERLILHMHERGYDATIAESIRSNERQQWLWGFGREYDDGRGIVTNSHDGRWSWHFFGLAVDIVSSSNGWDAPSMFWALLGLCAEREGLAWGGGWPTFPDRPHVQFGAPMRRSPSPHALELYQQGGREAVWREVGAL